MVLLTTYFNSGLHFLCIPVPRYPSWGPGFSNPWPHRKHAAHGQPCRDEGRQSMPRYLFTEDLQRTWRLALIFRPPHRPIELAPSKGVNKRSKVRKKIISKGDRRDDSIPSWQHCSMIIFSYALFPSSSDLSQSLSSYPLVHGPMNYPKTTTTTIQVVHFIHPLTCFCIAITTYFTYILPRHTVCLYLHCIMLHSSAYIHTCNLQTNQTPALPASIKHKSGLNARGLKRRGKEL